MTIRPMTAADIPAGMRLRELAGWNQTEQDWQRFLKMAPSGCFVACVDGRVRGTVTTLDFEKRLGWVSMVLVDPEYRRQGLGTRLLEAGVSALESARVETVKLDATSMGRTVYLQRGFVDEYGIERWDGVSRATKGAGFPIMKRADLTRVCDWDRAVFGADRSRLLESLWEENPRYSAVAYQGGEIAGYVLGRAGARAHYLGPWVAKPDTGIAEELVREFLYRVANEPVFVDICRTRPDAGTLVRRMGFQFQRSLTRMYRGPNHYPGEPAWVHGIAGPELG
jgi:ribosomal protein S18 acetylase RimI-like enzyme